MVAAANLLVPEQNATKLYTRAAMLLGKMQANPFQALGVSRRAVVLLAHYCAHGGRAAHVSTTAAFFGVSERTISYWHAELRDVFIAPEVRLFDYPIDTPHRCVPKWDPAGGKQGANLHGPKIALSELVTFLERAWRRRQDLRERESIDQVRRARGTPPELLPPKEPRPALRRHGPELPPEQPVRDADVATLAEAWNWLGLKNRDGSPSIVVIRPEPEDGSPRKPTAEENTLRARLRAGYSVAVILDAIRGAGECRWLRNQRAHGAFKYAMHTLCGAFERYATEGRKLAARDAAAPLEGSPTSLKPVAPIHDLVSGSTFSISPKPPLSADVAPAAHENAASPLKGTAPLAPSSHNGATRRESPPAGAPPSGTPPLPVRRRTTNEGEQTPHHVGVRSAAAMLVLLDTGGDATVHDARGRVLKHHRQGRGSLEERLRRVCPGCGLRAIRDDGMCGACGARKGP